MSDPQIIEGGYRLSAPRPPQTELLKVSVVTVVYNGEKFIEDTIKSVLNQTYNNIEHIIIDGGSKDGTIKILRRYSDQIAYWRSERDEGIYDGMNKGIAATTGEIIGTLNADDYYAEQDVIATVVKKFQDSGVHCVFGDVIFIDSETKKITRRYISEPKPERYFRWGFMPAHPTFFTFRSDYLKYGAYKTGYKIAADYELIMRFIKTNKVTYAKIPRSLVIMRMGGVSTQGWKSTVLLNREIVKACKENGIYTNMAMLYTKYFRKIREILLSHS
ncbi:glycosyltransferase family 2 protein [Deinococcus sp. UYEF24]